MFAFYGKKQGAATRAAADVDWNTRNWGKCSGFSYITEYGRGMK